MRLILSIILLAIAPALAFDYITESGGVLSFPKDGNGYRVPDYSYAGYDMSNSALPVHGVDYDTQVTLTTPSGNETARIQAAIDTVEALTPNGSGYRGAVVLGAGTWEIEADSLTIDASGVVIRGNGVDSTIIQWSVSGTPWMFRVGGVIPTTFPETLYKSGRTGSNWDITTAVVDVGDLSFDLEGGHGINIGDKIIIEHPCTSAWVAAIDGGCDCSDPDWPVDSVPLRMFRRVTNVATNTITIDAPIFYSLVKATAQCFVYVYTQTLTDKVGFENLTIDADTTVASEGATGAKECIHFNYSENCFIRNVKMRNFRFAGVNMVETTKVTIENCEATDPHSVITSARRYNYSGRGHQLVLIKDSYASKGRHNFISAGHGMDNGIVWLRCASDDNYAGAENGHQRWGQGVLFDNCIFRHVGTPEASHPFFDTKMLWVGNHGKNSNAHGWAGVTSMVWRCTMQAPGYVIVALPPTGRNYEFGTIGTKTSVHSAHGDYPGALDTPTTGTMPTSLFDAQLEQRLGGGSSPDWSADYDSIDFGSHENSSNTDIVVTYTNHSGGAVTGTVTEDSAEYSITVGGTFTGLADEATHQATIRFTPTSDGIHTATLTIDQGDGLAISVTGVGTTEQSGLSFDADTGSLVSSVVDQGTYIEATVRDDGSVSYTVDIVTSGTYHVSTTVNAPDIASNSWFVEFDSIPSSDTQIWDIYDLTSGMETRIMTRRGNGTWDTPTFEPMVWNLTSGQHTLNLEAREPGTQLQDLAITLIQAAATAGKGSGSGGDLLR